MKELDLLKKDWKKQDETAFSNLSQNDIYGMLHAKSSSIVKWIFIISIIEFIFWISFGFGLKLLGFDFDDGANTLGKSPFFITLTVINVIALVYFFYKFYINYKHISATESTKQLMQRILNTRQTVKYYVTFNIGILIVGTVLSVVYLAQYDSGTQSLINQASANGSLMQFYTTFALSTLLLLGICIGCILFLYWLTYGTLLKRLNKNYSELKKLEL